MYRLSLLSLAIGSFIREHVGTIPQTARYDSAAQRAVDHHGNRNRVDALQARTKQAQQLPFCRHSHGSQFHPAARFSEFAHCVLDGANGNLDLRRPVEQEPRRRYANLYRARDIRTR